MKKNTEQKMQGKRNHKLIGRNLSKATPQHFTNYLHSDECALDDIRNICNYNGEELFYRL